MNGNLEDASCVFGLILAGGKSSRMGKDKACLIHPRSKKMFLDHMIHLYKQMGMEDHQLWISGRMWKEKESFCLLDEKKAQGPLEGMRVFLKKVRPSFNAWVLVVPVDMPFLDAQGCLELFQKGCEGEGNEIMGRGVKHGEDKVLELICGESSVFPFWWRTSFYSQQCLFYCSQALAGKKRSLKFWRSLLSWKAVSLEVPKQFFWNLNTQNEWRYAKTCISV